MKNVLKSSFLVFFFLVGCGSGGSGGSALTESPSTEDDEEISLEKELDSGETGQKATLAVLSFESLPDCNAATDSQTYFVKEHESLYACLQSNWELVFTKNIPLKSVNCNINAIYYGESYDKIALQFLIDIYADRIEVTSLSAIYDEYDSDSHSFTKTIYAGFNSRDYNTDEFLNSLPTVVKNVFNDNSVAISDLYFYYVYDISTNKVRVFENVDAIEPYLYEPECTVFYEAD